MEARNGRSFGFSLKIAGTFLICGLTSSALQIHRIGHVEPRDFAVLLGPLASGTVLFPLIASLVPTVLGSGKLVFPLNFTLPLIHVMLVRTAVMLWTTPQFAAFQILDPLKPALFWIQVPALGALAFAECLVLSLGILRNNAET
jgi:hypothetical protein